MKWFKHMADASDDDFLENLEEKFGLEGYARWFKMLERIAIAMEKNRHDPSATHTVEKWCGYLKAKRKILFSFLEHSRNESKIKTETNGNVLTITCPNLLKLRDEYSRKSGHTPDNVAPEAEAEEDKERKTTPLPPNDIEKIPIKIPKIDQRKKENGNISFEAAAAACCSLLQKRLLAPSDSALLLGWLNNYDFELFVFPVLCDKTEKFIKKNMGKSPESLQYFIPAIQEKSRECG